MTRRKPTPVDYVRRPPVGAESVGEAIGYCPPLDDTIRAAAVRVLHAHHADDLLPMFGLDQEATA